MRIVFVNLHTNVFFLRDIKHIISGQRAIDKHRFLLNWLIENHVEVVNLITINGTSLPTSTLRRLTKKSIFRKAEAYFVFKKNNIPPRSIINITDPAEINENDIVWYYGTFAKNQFDSIKDSKGIKIVDQIHFYGDKEKADFLKKIDPKYFIYDVDLNKYSKLYKKNYSWFKGDFIIRPYSYGYRFNIIKKFEDRKTKAVAMGTLTKCLYEEFIKTYGSEYYQPHRKMIMDNADKYSKEIDSFISEFQEKELKEVSPKDNKFKRIYITAYNFFVSGKQKNYFSFDMVEKYNEYKMFICPEDINGSYGIGTIEGMACGCAMIGLKYGAFEDMGMEAGKHYISYDGTMEDLIEKIRYYQKSENQVELENIARTGCSFVRENFSHGKVAQNLYETLKRISEENENN